MGGPLHRLPAARVRERAWRAGAGWLLRPGRLRRGWQRRELRAPPPDRDQARPHRHACRHGLHHAGDHRQAAGLPLPVRGPEVRGRANGLAAISKVPAAGWGQILAYMAFCETSQDQSPGTAAAAGDFGFKVLTSSDPAEKTKKLAAEIANGRLA